jgi:tetratricopeptide (TPR) repeat protein
MDASNAAAAVKDYSRAVELSPRDPALYLDKGSAEQLIGNYSSAESDFLASARLTSANPAQIVRAAEGLGQIGFYRDALSVLEDGIRRYGSYWDLYRYRGEVLGAIGEDAAALASFTAALKLASGPDLAFVLTTRANLYLRRQQYALAVEDFDQAIVVQPSAYWEYEARAKAKQSQGHLTSAEGDLDTAIKMLSPQGLEGKRNLARLYEERARVFLEEGRRDEAAADIEQAIVVLPLSDTGSRDELSHFLAQVNS